MPSPRTATNSLPRRMDRISTGQKPFWSREISRGWSVPAALATIGVVALFNGSFSRPAAMPNPCEAARAAANTACKADSLSPACLQAGDTERERCVVDVFAPKRNPTP